MNRKFPKENQSISFPEYLQFLIRQYKRLTSEESNQKLEIESSYPGDTVEKLNRR